MGQGVNAIDIAFHVIDVGQFDPTPFASDCAAHGLVTDYALWTSFEIEATMMADEGTSCRPQASDDEDGL